MNCYLVLDEICRYSAAAELRIFCACLVCICAGASLLHTQTYLRFLQSLHALFILHT